jgi:nitrate reductase (cytochrome), electron transfer subunit
VSRGSDVWIKFVLPIVLLASAVAIALAVRGGLTWMQRDSQPDTAVVVMPGSDEPIAAEAEVFRTSARLLAIDPASGGRRPAHPRTLFRYRTLRAYPGAPPRIPHGLTPEETHSGSCNTCHERGGYSQRFGAYVPINPHPEQTACLQCHVGDAPLMAVPLPDTDPSARCMQCHSPGAARPAAALAGWQPMTWPELPRRTRDDPPPAIPHGRHMRENCLACHAAPAAVAEIRTTHPERANCRQCHVESEPPLAGFGRASAPIIRDGGDS